MVFFLILIVLGCFIRFIFFIFEKNDYNNIEIYKEENDEYLSKYDFDNKNRVFTITLYKNKIPIKISKYLYNDINFNDINDNYIKYMEKDDIDKMNNNFNTLHKIKIHEY